jgi:hypothetical protein
MVFRRAGRAGFAYVCKFGQAPGVVVALAGIEVRIFGTRGLQDSFRCKFDELNDMVREMCLTQCAPYSPFARQVSLDSELYEASCRCARKSNRGALRKK